MIAKIHLKKIQVDVLIGAKVEEREQTQPLIIDASFDVEVSCATKTDDINHTIDYSHVVNDIIEISKKTHFHLLESFIYHLNYALIKKYDLKNLFLKVHKPLATKGLAEVHIEL